MTTVDNNDEGMQRVEPIAPFANFSDEGLRQIRGIYADLVPNRGTLALLFALDAAQTAPCDGWRGFFVESASAFLIWEQRPTGKLGEADARWVLARFDEAPSLGVLALMVRLLDEATVAPAWFEAAVRHRASLFHGDAGHAGRARKSVPHLRLVA